MVPTAIDDDIMALLEVDRNTSSNQMNTVNINPKQHLHETTVQSTHDDFINDLLDVDNEFVGSRLSMTSMKSLPKEVRVCIVLPHNKVQYFYINDSK